MLLFILILTFASTVKCERLHEQIYSSIEGAAACFRRLNATHQAGCSSVDGGAVGAVHWLWSLEDARWVADGGGGGGPYVALVSTLLFNKVADTLMARPDNIAGVVLYENGTYVPSFWSPESHCPNEYTAAAGSTCGASDSEAWNPHGSGLLRRDIPFPVFYLPASRNEEVDKILNCYRKFNEWERDDHAGRPLCSVQLSSFMFAAVNTEVCMRRSSTINLNPTKQCDPIGDRNIYATLFPRSEETQAEGNGRVVLVTARIDSASLFDGLSPGAASSAVSVVTFLTAAATLSAMLPPERAAAYKRNVVWALFSGESFDYIGSQRVAYDMRTGAWPPGAPLPPAHVDLHVELGQLGGDLARGAAGEWALNAFTPPYSTPHRNEIVKFIDTIQTAEPRLSVAHQETANLPPSSLHSFRRILGAEPERGGLAHLLLVDHNQTFTNQFYQSVLDDRRNVHFHYCNLTVDEKGTFIDTSTMIANGFLNENDTQVKISILASAVAKALYQRVTGEAYAGTNSASAHMVDELLHCYLESGACRLFAASEYGPAEGDAEPELPGEPNPLYTGVLTWYNRAPYSTGLLLALLTGQVNTTVRQDCPASNDKGYSFYWVNGWNMTGVCIRSSMNFTDAVSPAFTIPGYDYASGLYSTWTESVWRGMWARVFVAPSGRGARVAAALGATATLLVALLTYWLHRHSDLVFPPRTTASTLAINQDPSAAGILRTVNC